MSLDRYDLAVGSGISSASSARLLYISASKYDGDWHSILHTHNCTELFYVLRGQGRFLVGDTDFPVSEGDLVIVAPNTEHTETSLDAAPLEYIVVGIEGFSFLIDPLQPYRLLSFRSTATDILTHLRSILRETKEQAPGYELVCHNLLNVVLVQVARHMGLEPDSSQPMLASRESTAARRYIDAHYRENLTLDTLAQAVHISKYHLVHIFSREYGISPIHYLLQLRLRECRDLLRTTDYSVAQIARMVGFSSPSYFSQRFRKAEGMTPAQYRQQFNESP